MVISLLIPRVQKNISLVVHKWKSNVLKLSSDFFKHPFHSLLLGQLEFQLFQSILSSFACLTCMFLGQYLSFTTNEGSSLVQHKIGQMWIAPSQYFKGFVACGSCNEGIGAGNSRDDIFGDPQSQHRSNSLDIELTCPQQSLLIDPIQMLHIVIVPDLVRPLLFPLFFKHILNTVLWSSGFVGNSAIVRFRFTHQSIQQRALIATCLVWFHQNGLPLKAFSSSINVVTNCVLLVLIEQKYYFVQIFSGFDIVQPSDDDWKFGVLLVGDLLDLFLVCRYFDPRAPFHHKCSHNICLVFADVLLSEQKLTVQIGKIDCVHVHQMDVSHSAEGQVFDDLASETSRPHNQDRHIRNGLVEG